MVPNRHYLLSTTNSPSDFVGGNSSGLKAFTYQGEEKPKSFNWKFIQTDVEGVYCIQNLITKRYISSVQNGLRVKAESCDTANAVMFSLEMVAPGEFYIQSTDNKNVRLYNKDDLIYAGNQTDANAKWFLWMEEEQNTDNMLELPDISTDEQLTFYYLIRTDNGEYAYSSTAARTKGRIVSGIYKDSEDHGYWFYFKQGSQEGKYTIHNHKTEKAVVNDNNKLYVNKDTEACQFAINLDEQGMGLNLSTEGGNWHMTGTTEMVEINSEKSTTWKLQRIGTISLTNISENKVGTTLTAHTAEGVIKIDGLTKGCVVKVYNTIGNLITKATATSSTMTINTGLPIGSTAIITAGTHCIKVQMR